MPNVRLSESRVEALEPCKSAYNVRVLSATYSATAMQA